MTKNTQPSNYLELCAISMSLPQLTANGLPLGYQLMATAGNDAKLLAIAVELEKVIGTDKKPNLSAFFK